MVGGAWRVAGAVGLSWVGFAVHNLGELGGRGLAGPLTSARRLAAVLLLGWAWLQLVGGGLLSALPVPLWPYRPEQSLAHYGLHAVYALAQVPLLVLLMRYRTVPADRAR